MAGEERRTAAGVAVYREMPANVDVEQALIGAVLLHNNAYARVAGIVDETMFAEDLHRRIWKVIATLVQKGQVATIPIVKGYLGDQDLGGFTVSQYLARLAANATTVSNADQYAVTVRDLYFRRETIERLTAVVDMAFDAPVEATAESIIAAALNHLTALKPNPQATEDFEDWDDVATRGMATLQADWRDEGRAKGLSTGFAKLDDILGGLYAPNFIILGGRPGSGKSALATNIAWNVAKALKAMRDEGQKTGVVGYYSLEMSSDELWQRIVSDVTGIAGWRIKRPKGLSDNEMSRIADVNMDIRRLPLKIDQTGKLTIAQLEMRARTLKRRQGLELLVIDYLQLVGARKTSSREENRTQELTDITTSLKALAKELNVPILALAQLNRKVDERPLQERRPRLSDLRESGSIEQDADKVMFIFREEYYLKDEKPREGTDAYVRWQSDMRRCAGVAEVIIGKQRHGRTGTVTMGFQGDYTRFLNEPEPREPDPEPPQKQAKEREPNATVREALVALGALKKVLREKGTESRGAVEGIHKGTVYVPYDVWREEATNTVLDPDATDQQKTAYMKRVSEYLMYQQLMVRGGEASAYVWLTEKGKRAGARD